MAGKDLAGSGVRRLGRPRSTRTVPVPVCCSTGSEGKTVKNRVHLDVRAGGPRDTPKDRRSALVDAEATRLADVGASHVSTIETGEDYFAVMLDPEGNEFCVC